MILECEKQGTLYKLCPVLLAEYPENTHLREAVAPWMENKSGGAAEKTPKVKASEVKAPEVIKVPVQIPAALVDEFSDEIDEIPVTLQSIRADLAYLSKDIQELKRWRQEVAVMAAKSMAGEKESEANVSVSLPDKKDKS